MVRPASDEVIRRLQLYDFVCAWFDEYDYFEFYPLHVVHKITRRR